MSLRDQVLAASRQADSENPQRLRTNRNVDCFNHATRAIELLLADGLKADYIGKTAGEGQYTPASGFPRPVGNFTITGVSHDAIWVNGVQFDLIASGNDGPEPLGSPGIPIANEIPAQYYRPNNPPVPYPIGNTAPVPVPPAVSYPGDTYFIEHVGVPLESDYTQAGQSLNAGSATWFARTIFDAINGAMTMDASVAKHRAEWRSALGLPPV